ncbi:MAG: efflux RND transporter periplasmic adaptor subunit [Burkholderiales bacterium]|nr:efflux RND transporter periplasmic adaptor subunit [Burkholderiales bacterium]
MTTPATNATGPNGQRRRLMLALLTVFGVAAIGYGAYWNTVVRFHVDTDNAYVAGNIVQVTPQTAGTIVTVNADDTDFVEAGQPLIKLDRADAELAVETADAQLGQTVREVRTLFANDGTLRATVGLRETDLNRAKEDLARRQGLAGSGAVAAEDIQHAKDAVNNAQAALKVAQEQLASNQTLIDHTSLRLHPNVRRAVLKVREAQLALDRTTVPSPVTGYVAHRVAQPGQRVNVGTPMMAVVPLDQIWIDANFKESQLADMRIGQPVDVNADLYGSKVTYHGKIVGFSAGTGTVFSLLPAQNATGNWIKVVQRLPVRISLDPKEVAEHPLRIGLSIRADVDTHDRNGATLSTVHRATPVADTQVYAGQGVDAAKQADASLAKEITQ